MRAEIYQRRYAIVRRCACLGIKESRPRFDIFNTVAETAKRADFWGVVFKMTKRIQNIPTRVSGPPMLAGPVRSGRWW